MFNEPHFIKLIFTLADTQAWLNELSKETYNSIPVLCKRKFLSKTYYLSITALAHIIERHYYKIPRHPGVSKFHIPLPDILNYIKEAQQSLVTPVPGNNNFKRTLQTNELIGYDRDGLPTTSVTVITDAVGNIITAFPGICHDIQSKTPPHIREVHSADRHTGSLESLKKMENR